jgi:hypothetical protein
LAGRFLHGHKQTERPSADIERARSTWF